MSPEGARNYLTDDIRAQQVRMALRQLAAQHFECELSLVANRGNGQAETQAFQARQAELSRGIANLEAEYADLLTREEAPPT